MKKIFIATIALFLTFSILPADGQVQRKTRTKRNSLEKIEKKKDVIRERDSLKVVVNLLKAELDSLYDFGSMIALSDTLEQDSLNAGSLLNMIEAFGLTGDSVTRDSMLSMWYHKRDLSLLEMEPENIDSIFFTSDVPDSVYLERLKNMNSYISLPYNTAIRNHIIYYTQKMPEKMETILGLADYYIPLFEEIFDMYDLPLELTAMAVIESALNAKAVSRAGAKGMWQFMYTTAKRYGLTINSYVDERYDPVAAAHAAARYLRDSYLIFKDWNLAIASYNCGAGNVNKAIRRSGRAAEFWDIYPYLPRETRGYVPSFYGALYAMTYYKEHNLQPKPVVMPPHVDTIQVNKMLHFDQIAHYTGISTKELRTHNPQYLHDIIPGTRTREYILRIPYEYTPKFIDNEDSIYAWKDSVYFNPSTLKKIQEGGSANATRIVHKVRKGETLSHIAMKYGVSVRNIQRWNGIGTRIKIGQRIIIYKNGYAPSRSSSAHASTSKSGGYEYYTVRKGDNLWDIAKKFSGVSVNSIMSLNGLNKNSKIYPGKKLKIRKL